MQGPNVRKLIATRIAQLAIPANGGFVDGIKALMSKEMLTKYARESTSWVQKAITIVKSAPDNPYGNDDEQIAKAILDMIEAKKNVRH